jgi:hypothetical protein
MMKLLGDNVCISRIHGGGRGMWFGCAVNQQRFRGSQPEAGESHPKRYHHNRSFFQNRNTVSLTAHDEKPLMMRRKPVGRNFRPENF